MNGIAYIDLVQGTAMTEEVPGQWRRLFLGGRGINTFLLYNLTRQNQDNGNQDSPLIFGCGMLTGIPGIGTSRYNVTGRAPYSGLLGDSNAGGFFAPELRFAGYDHLVLSGKAKTPTMIWIHDGEIEFVDASFLENLSVPDTFDAIRKKMKDADVQIAAIGPAGRRSVKVACIMNSVNNANGHCGMGALMGSKNVWAIAVRGRGDLPVAHPKLLLEVLQKQYAQVTGRKGFKASSYYGTLMRMNLMRTEMTLDYLAAQTNFYELGDEMDTDVFMEKYQYAAAACFNCPMHTKHVHVIRGGPEKGKQGGGAEFADAYGYGSFVGVKSWDTTLACSGICNDYGIDKGTSAKILGGVMWLYQDGLITGKHTGGLKMEWGSHDAVTTFLRQLSTREGFGGTFSDGWKEGIKRLFGEDKAAQYDKYCPHVKGEPIETTTAYKMIASHALGAATASRGSCHLRSRFTIDELGLPAEALARLVGHPIDPDPTVTEGKAAAVIWSEDLCSVGDALGMCRFLSKWMTPGFLGFDEWAELIYAGTGLQFSAAQLREVGERIWNVERMFLVREGLSREEDALPDNVFDEPMKVGKFKGRVQNREKFSRMLDEYYQEHGWDESGIPCLSTLKRLELDRILNLDGARLGREKKRHDSKNKCQS